MVRLTTELIDQCASYTNPVKDREIDFRGYKIPVIENLGATLDQFDTMDFSDNEIRKLDGFPYLRRLKHIIINNNKVVRIADNLEHSLPQLESIILTNNNVQELGDLDILSTIPNLKILSLLGNPVIAKPHYRLYVVHKIPQLRILDFRKIKEKERKEAKAMFKGKRGAALAKDIGKRTKTFTPGGDLVNNKPSAQAKQDAEVIKKAIANAKTLDEVERLQAMLQAGQVPGKQAQMANGSASSNRQEEEMDE